MSIISVNNLEKRFGDNIILQNVSTQVNKGEVISIIGPSGTGKSTFLRAINFLDPPTDGDVIFNGEKITKKNVDTVRRHMGMVFQNFGLFSHLTVLENLMLGPVRLLGASRSDAASIATELLRTVGLSERADFYPRQLSGGQKQRVAIARCLAMSPDVILFDEPTSALDPTMVTEVMAVIRNLAKSGMTMLVVTHEMSFARDVSTRVLYMDEKGIYEQGSPGQIFENPTKPKTQSFIFNIRSFNHDITGRDFDYVEMLGGIENFCFRHAIDKKIANKIHLLAEELIINIVAKQFGACFLNIHYSDKLDSYEVTVSYEEKKVNALKSSDDDLSVMMVQKTAKEIHYDYIDGENIIKALI